MNPQRINPPKPCRVWFDGYAGRNFRTGLITAETSRMYIVRWTDEPRARKGPGSKAKGTSNPVPKYSVSTDQTQEPAPCPPTPP